MELPDFLVIPSILIRDKNLQPLDGQVYGIIYWYTKQKLQRCIASNKYIADLLGVNPMSVSNSISRLTKGKYVTSVMDGKNHRIELIPNLSFTPGNVTPTPPSNDIGGVHQIMDAPPSNDGHNKKELIREINKTTNKLVAYGNADINALCTYFLEQMKIPKEDCTSQQSRRYWNLLLKESKKGLSGVRWLIDIAASDEFFRNNISSSKDLYYKRTKLIMRVRGDRPKIAVMPQKGGAAYAMENNTREKSLLVK